MMQMGEYFDWKEYPAFVRIVGEAYVLAAPYGQPPHVSGEGKDPITWWLD
jgi:hypothetical protein